MDVRLIAPTICTIIFLSWDAERCVEGQTQVYADKHPWPLICSSRMRTSRAPNCSILPWPCGHQRARIPGIRPKSPWPISNVGHSPPWAVQSQKLYFDVLYNKLLIGQWDQSRKPSNKMYKQSRYSAQRILVYIYIYRYVGHNSATLLRSMESKGGANKCWLIYACCNNIAFIATL